MCFLNINVVIIGKTISPHVGYFLQTLLILQVLVNINCYWCDVLINDFADTS
jgi:hypothetical protein